MSIKRILITLLLTGVGFILTPMTFAFIADSVEQSRPQRELPADFGSADLLELEQEAIAKYQQNVELIAFVSVVGAVGGAVLGVAVTRPKKIVPESVN